MDVLLGLSGLSRVLVGFGGGVYSNIRVSDGAFRAQRVRWGRGLDCCGPEMVGPTASRTNKSIRNVTSISAAAIAQAVDDVFQRSKKKAGAGENSPRLLRFWISVAPDINSKFSG